MGEWWMLAEWMFFFFFFFVSWGLSENHFPATATQNTLVQTPPFALKQCRSAVLDYGNMMVLREMRISHFCAYFCFYESWKCA